MPDMTATCVAGVKGRLAGFRAADDSEPCRWAGQEACAHAIGLMFRRFALNGRTVGHLFHADVVPACLMGCRDSARVRHAILRWHVEGHSIHSGEICLEESIGLSAAVARRLRVQDVAGRWVVMAEMVVAGLRVPSGGWRMGRKRPERWWVA